MKKIPQKKLNQIKKLENQQEKLTKEYLADTAVLEKTFGIEDSHYNIEQEKWTDNEHEFEFERSIKYANYDRESNIIQAKKAACFLVATNIARRGKLLHPEVAKKKLKKYGKDVQFIVNMIDEQYYIPQIGALPYLARELYRSYHITLMGESMYNYCQNMIDRYSMLLYGEEKLQHYKNFAKKFHEANIRKSCLLRQKLEERPF